MERLTKRDSYGDVYVKQHDYVTASERIAECEGFEDFEEIFRKKMTDTASERLCEYEDLEEQGLLLRLPVKIGSTLYQPISNQINEYKVTGLRFDNTRNEFMYEVAYRVGLEWYTTTCDFDCINKTVFLTREEAEQKLKESECD